MTNERQDSLGRLKNFYVQIHLTVIYETDFIKQLNGQRALQEYRDEILDRINRERRFLGFLS
jgi:hypothetical protein